MKNCMLLVVVILLPNELFAQASKLSKDELIRVGNCFYKEDRSTLDTAWYYVKLLEGKESRTDFALRMASKNKKQSGGGGPPQGPQTKTVDVGPHPIDDFLIASLGHRRAAAAVPILTKIIDQEVQYWYPQIPLKIPPPWVQTTERKFPRKYPAYRALVMIGMPSCWAALEELPHEANPERRKLFTELLFAVAKKPASIALLEDLKTKVVEETEAQRVAEAISYIQAKADSD